MAASGPFWKWHHWKSIGFCLWPPSTCIWNLKLKFQSKLDLCSGNHVVYRQTDGRTDGRTRWIQYTLHSNFVGRGYNYSVAWYIHTKATFIKDMDQPSQTHLVHSTKLAFTLPVAGHSCDSIFLGCTLKLRGMLRCHIRFCGANQ